MLNPNAAVTHTTEHGRLGGHACSLWDMQRIRVAGVEGIVGNALLMSLLLALTVLVEDDYSDYESQST